MAGQIKRMIDRIVDERSHGHPTIALATRTKIMLWGVRVDSYTSTSPDDVAVLAKLRTIAEELGVAV